MFADGGLTNYVVLPKQYCYKVAPETKPELMGVAEPLAGCGCALEKLNVHVGDTACVLGAGPIGLMFIALLKANGLPQDHRFRADRTPPQAGAGGRRDPRGQSRYREPGAADCQGGNRRLGVDHCVEAVAAMLVDCVYLVRPHGKVLQFDTMSWPARNFRSPSCSKNEIEVYGGYLGSIICARSRRS